MVLALSFFQRKARPFGFSTHQAPCACKCIRSWGQGAASTSSRWQLHHGETRSCRACGGADPHREWPLGLQDASGGCSLSRSTEWGGPGIWGIATPRGGRSPGQSWSLCGSEGNESRMTEGGGRKGAAGGVTRGESTASTDRGPIPEDRCSDYGRRGESRWHQPGHRREEEHRSVPGGSLGRVPDGLSLGQGGS